MMANKLAVQAGHLQMGSGLGSNPQESMSAHTGANTPNPPPYGQQI